MIYVGKTDIANISDSRKSQICNQSLNHVLKASRAPIATWKEEEKALMIEIHMFYLTSLTESKVFESLRAFSPQTTAWINFGPPSTKWPRIFYFIALGPGTTPCSLTFASLLHPIHKPCSAFFFKFTTPLPIVKTFLHFMSRMQLLLDFQLLCA